MVDRLNLGFTNQEPKVRYESGISTAGTPLDGRFRKSAPNPVAPLGPVARQPDNADIIGRFVKNAVCDATREC